LILSLIGKLQAYLKLLKEQTAIQNEAQVLILSSHLKYISDEKHSIASLLSTKPNKPIQD
jgi:hypothetical protein